MTEKDYFPFDPDVTDLTIIVEEKKLHVSKMVLINASPVFRKMFTGNFKEKGAMEVEFPGKKYSTFVLFLRCIFPMEYVTLNENDVGDLLPLAHEYDVKCVLRQCETRLLTAFELKEATPVTLLHIHLFGLDDKVNYYMKCLYYGLEYDLRELYDKVFPRLAPYNLKRYAKSKFYELLPEKNKRELLQSRLSKIEGSGKYNENDRDYPPSNRSYKCSADLFM